MSSFEIDTTGAIAPSIAIEHREPDWGWRYRQPKTPPKRSGKFRIRDLLRVFNDRYGPVIENDDAGAEDCWIMAHHLAHLPQPELRIRDFLRLRAPWYTDGGTEWLIEKVLRNPLRWEADTLGRLLRLSDADRTRLGITTIGGFDVPKGKRTRRRREKDAARHRKLRADVGARPHATSLARTEPWRNDGCSRATWFRRRRLETGETNSSAPYSYITVETKQSHNLQKAAVNPCRSTSAPPGLKPGVLARAVPALPDGETIFDTDTPLSPRVFPTAARARDFHLTAASTV